MSVSPGAHRPPLADMDNDLARNVRELAATRSAGACALAKTLAVYTAWPASQPPARLPQLPGFLQWEGQLEEPIAGPTSVPGERGPNGRSPPRKSRTRNPANTRRAVRRARDRRVRAAVADVLGSSSRAVDSPKPVAANGVERSDENNSSPSGPGAMRRSADRTGDCSSDEGGSPKFTTAPSSPIPADLHSDTARVVPQSLASLAANFALSAPTTSICGYDGVTPSPPLPRVREGTSPKPKNDIPPRSSSNTENKETLNAADGADPLGPFAAARTSEAPGSEDVYLQRGVNSSDGTQRIGSLKIISRADACGPDILMAKGPGEVARDEGEHQTFPPARISPSPKIASPRVKRGKGKPKRGFNKRATRAAARGASEQTVRDRRAGTAEPENSASASIDDRKRDASDHTGKDLEANIASGVRIDSAELSAGVETAPDSLGSRTVKPEMVIEPVVVDVPRLRTRSGKSGLVVEPAKRVTRSRATKKTGPSIHFNAEPSRKNSSLDMKEVHQTISEEQAGLPAPRSEHSTPERCASISTGAEIENPKSGTVQSQSESDDSPVIRRRGRRPLVSKKKDISKPDNRQSDSSGRKSRESGNITRSREIGPVRSTPDSGATRERGNEADINVSVQTAKQADGEHPTDCQVDDNRGSTKSANDDQCLPRDNDSSVPRVSFSREIADDTGVVSIHSDMESTRCGPKAILSKVGLNSHVSSLTPFTSEALMSPNTAAEPVGSAAGSVSPEKLPNVSSALASKGEQDPGNKANWANDVFKSQTHSDSVASDMLMPPPPARLPLHATRHAKVAPQTPLQPQSQAVDLQVNGPVSEAPSKRFTVDEKGKVGMGALAALNEVVSTPRGPSFVAGSMQPPSSSIAGVSAIRTGRLYAAAGDIYSSTRKPSHARVRAIQSSAIQGSNSSVVAKTPGMRAPLETLRMRSQQMDHSVVSHPIISQPPAHRPTQIPGRTRSAAALSEKPHQDLSSRLFKTPGKHVSCEPSQDQGRPNMASVSVVGSKTENLSGEENPVRAISEKSPLGKRSQAFEEVQTASKTGKRPRIAFVEPEAVHKQSSNLEQHSTKTSSIEPRTAPLRNVRRPRIVTTKSALRSRIEGRRIDPKSEDVNVEDTGDSSLRFETPGPSKPSNARTSHSNPDQVHNTSAVSAGSSQDAGPSGDSVLSMTRARVVPVHRMKSSVDVAEDNDVPGNVKDEASVLSKPSTLHSSSVPGYDGGLNTEKVNRGSEDSTEATPPASSQLGNLMTSISSFLPSFRPRKDDVEEESAEERAKAVQEQAAADALRRAAEVQRRREETRVQRQRELEERQRKIDARRELMAKEQRCREEERKRKEAERARKLADAEAARRRQKEDEERRRQEKRRRVEEQQRRLAAQEEERRKALEEKERAQRERLRKAKGGPGPSGPSSSSAKPAATPGRGANKPKAGGSKRSPPPESYEMSATKENDGDSSDSETERARRRKRIPGWARSANLPQSLVGETRDPDSIFDKVNTINLEEVFQGHPSKRRYRARASSGMWVRDRLTAKEELEYKKLTTGFDSTMPPPPDPI